MKKRRRKKQVLWMKPQEWLIITALGIGVLLLLVVFRSKPVTYEVVLLNEDKTQTIQYYHQYSQAKQAYQDLLTGNQNPAILEDGKIINIRYGIVNFKTKSCQENTSYKIDGTDKVGYTNGCYGADGLFLGLSDDTKDVLFKQSGALGWVSRNDVEILNMKSNAAPSVSFYQFQDNHFYHKISTDISNNPVASIDLGMPGFTVRDTKLYSYDGHYFYPTFEQMADDERLGVQTHAVNADAPYYNYYQYMSHRGKSNYAGADIDSYITDYLGYGKKSTSYPPAATESLLVDEGKHFIQYQNKYGVNAVMMLSLAINESSFGRSELAIAKNNLFSHAAYDIAPKDNATAYQSVGDSIHAHAKVYLSKGYLDPCDQSINVTNPKICRDVDGNRYGGGFFGDKSGGMNVKYASDPYWGEKAAAHYRNIDITLGGKDQSYYTLGMIDGRKAWEIHQQPDRESPLLYITPNYTTYSVIILEKVKGGYYEDQNDWYKIQSDAILNQDRSAITLGDGTYRSSDNVAYIPAKAVEGGLIK